MITSHGDQPDDPEAASDRSANPPGATRFAGDDGPDDDPCAFGRCTDPAAHAEGAHDL